MRAVHLKTRTTHHQTSSYQTYSAPEDHPSTCLRIFLQQLTSIKLRNLAIGSNLLWPLDSNGSQIKFSNWPKLKSFTLDYIPVTRTGKWLFELPPGEEIRECTEPETPFSNYLPDEPTR